MKNWVIPVYAEVGALIDVQANSLKEAMDKVKDIKSVKDLYNEEVYMNVGSAYDENNIREEYNYGKDDE